jgi:hypothetical protein
MDNGMPWGTQSRLPSAFGLWLVGLGITPVYGRPARSTDNAIVERDHGVLAKWVELDQCADFADCQQRVAWAVQTQRERYRAPDGYTRLQAYPTLRTNPRRYEACHEAQHWSLPAVAEYLAQRTFQRKVEINGCITLFANGYSVGRAHARQQVDVELDAQRYEWVISDAYQRPLCRHPAKELDYTRISRLQLAKRRRS